MPNKTSASNASSTDSNRQNHDKTISEVFGEIVWLMTQSDEHKEIRIAQLEALIMPNILLRQFKIFYRDSKPFAAVIYAMTSQQNLSRLEFDGDNLALDQWKTGNIKFVTRVIAPFGMLEEIRREIEC